MIMMIVSGRTIFEFKILDNQFSESEIFRFIKDFTVIYKLVKKAAAIDCNSFSFRISYHHFLMPNTKVVLFKEKVQGKTVSNLYTEVADF